MVPPPSYRVPGARAGFSRLGRHSAGGLGAAAAARQRGRLVTPARRAAVTAGRPTTRRDSQHMQPRHPTNGPLPPPTRPPQALSRQRRLTSPGETSLPAQARRRHPRPQRLRKSRDNALRSRAVPKGLFVRRKLIRSIRSEARESFGSVALYHLQSQIGDEGVFTL